MAAEIRWMTFLAELDTRSISEQLDFLRVLWPLQGAVEVLIRSVLYRHRGQTASASSVTSEK